MTKYTENETTLLCSKKSLSLLRLTDKNSMSSFPMDEVSREIHETAPLFYSMLQASTVKADQLVLILLLVPWQWQLLSVYGTDQNI